MNNKVSQNLMKCPLNQYRAFLLVQLKKLSKLIKLMVNIHSDSKPNNHKKPGILHKNYFEKNEENRLKELEKIIDSGEPILDDCPPDRFEIHELK